MNSLQAWLMAEYRFAIVAKWVVFRFVRLLWGLQVEGREHVPEEGGLIIACNHLSSADPPVVGSVCPRNISFMAKKELFNQPLVRFFLVALYAYPVDRENNDTQAIKTSLRKLQAGETVGIFFEGRRNQGEAEARGGAAFLAQRANVPLVPTAIWRQEGAFHVKFGQPIYPEAVVEATASRKEKMSVLTQTLREAVRTLQG